MITVDAKGKQCPIPVIETKKAINSMKEADTLIVFVDNEIAVQNVSRLCTNLGAQTTSEKTGENEYQIKAEITGEVIGAAMANAVSDDISCAPDKRSSTVVVVSSDVMGHGNDELGKVLIKGFLFAVSQLDQLPAKILFYNGGAKLTCEDSASLADLKNMEAQGVEILTCGTCLDYYNLKEKLAVGSVTNMYAIVEAMNNAGKILKP